MSCPSLSLHTFFSFDLFQAESCSIFLQNNPSFQLDRVLSTSLTFPVPEENEKTA